MLICENLFGSHLSFDLKNISKYWLHETKLVSNNILSTCSCHFCYFSSFPPFNHFVSVSQHHSHHDAFINQTGHIAATYDRFIGYLVLYLYFIYIYNYPGICAIGIACVVKYLSLHLQYNSFNLTC